MMRKNPNVTKRYIGTINLQLYNASTKASDVASVRSCGTTELRKTENYSVVKFNSSQRVFQ
jgi:hypothetical protein